MKWQLKKKILEMENFVCDSTLVLLLQNEETDGES